MCTAREQSDPLDIQVSLAAVHTGQFWAVTTTTTTTNEYHRSLASSSPPPPPASTTSTTTRWWLLWLPGPLHYHQRAVVARWGLPWLSCSLHHHQWAANPNPRFQLPSTTTNEPSLAPSSPPPPPTSTATRWWLPKGPSSPPQLPWLCFQLPPPPTSCDSSLGGLFVIFLMLPYHYQLNKSFLVVMF